MNKDKSLQISEHFENDIAELGKQANLLVQCASPYLAISETSVREYLDNDSAKVIEGMRFFKLNSCTTEQVDDLATHLNEKMGKLFTAIHPLGVPVAYGIVSYEGKTNLVLGVGSKEAQEVVESFIRGLLTGIDLTPFVPQFTSRPDSATVGGIVSAVPIVKIEEDKQKFDISTLMRSLNGQDYTVLCVAKPYSLAQAQQTYGDIVSVRDKCFAVSKKNLAQQRSASNTNAISESLNVSAAIGFMAGPVMLGVNAGASFSDSFAKTIGTSDTVSYDVQNGLALELIEYCDKAIERLRQGQNMGMWGMAIAYSASKAITGNIIKACLCGELSKPASNVLPPKSFSYDLEEKKQILIPYLDRDNALLAPVTSSELGMVCTPPAEAVPDFEMKRGIVYPMVGSSADGVVIGNISDGHRPLKNMKFTLSEADLNKHTFVCGITGSGKTTTVKGILASCD